MRRPKLVEGSMIIEGPGVSEGFPRLGCPRLPFKVGAVTAWPVLPLHCSGVWEGSWAFAWSH